MMDDCFLYKSRDYCKLDRDVMNAHKLDAMVAIPNCDKIVPGMIMGALRVNVPTLFVSGGPMAKGYKKDGTPIDLATVFEAIGEFEAGDITAEELNEIECNACPSGGVVVECLLQLK